MSRFIESILLENGKCPLLKYHQQRYEACIEAHYPGVQPRLLSNLIGPYITDKGIYKIRIVYDDIHYDIQCIPYHPKQAKKFFLIEAPELDYTWKYADRKGINTLKQGLPEDAEIIIVKNGRITDSSIANLAFQNNGKWFTPRKPLLKGTRRQYLLDKGDIFPADIHIRDLYKFSVFRSFNAMCSLIKSPSHPLTLIQSV